MLSTLEAHAAEEQSRAFAHEHLRDVSAELLDLLEIGHLPADSRLRELARQCQQWAVGRNPMMVAKAIVEEAALAAFEQAA